MDINLLTESLRAQAALRFNELTDELATIKETNGKHATFDIPAGSLYSYRYPDRESAKLLTGQIKTVRSMLYFIKTSNVDSVTLSDMDATILTLFIDI